jgi:hypothetical protein
VRATAATAPATVPPTATATRPSFDRFPAGPFAEPVPCLTRVAPRPAGVLFDEGFLDEGGFDARFFVAAAFAREAPAFARGLPALLLPCLFAVDRFATPHLRWRSTT